MRELEASGVLSPAVAHVDQDFIDPYRWMIEQMAARGIDVPSSRFPIWAWRVARSVTRPRPDLRSSGHMPRGTPAVCIELDAPSELVLLSQFELWHGVLNGFFVAKDKDEMDAHQRLHPSRRAVTVQQSWSRIFDLEFGAVDHWGPVETRLIQACLPVLRREWVCLATPFRAR